MTELKILGAILILAGCGSFGLMMAMQYRKEIASLRQMLQVLDYMESELEYRLTPLPELCRLAAERAGGCLKKILRCIASEMESQVSPNVQACLLAAQEKCSDISKSITQPLEMLGQTLGMFDLPGQIKGLHAVRQHCKRELDELEMNKQQRIRNYQTLALCAGAALAILCM